MFPTTNISDSILVALDQVTSRVVESPADPNWDAFLLAQPNGHHTQSSLWASLKSRHGWCVTRIVLERGNRIVAGAQLLSRRLARFPLRVGYVPNGPMAEGNDPALIVRVVDAVERAAFERRVVLLRVQPPPRGEAGEEILVRRGYARSRTPVSPVSTLLLDLSRTEASLLEGLSPGVRRNVRQSARRGVSVRIGGPEDLPEFHRLMTLTSRRHGFVPYGLDYFSALWEEFAPTGGCALLLAEHDGRAVAANLLLLFNQTATMKFGASAHDHRRLKANDLLQWECIRWARARGSRWYDFEGIDPRLAELLLRREPLPPVDTPGLGPSYFKLGFGGRPVMNPPAFERGLGPFGLLFRVPLLPRLANSGPIVNWVRRSSAGG